MRARRPAGAAAGAAARRPARLPLAVALFFFSGALGLGYELVWIRKAALVVGASQIALSTVLTSFFLGLGVGSLVVGRYLRRGRLSPLYVYGLFELGIGLYALVFPELFRLLEHAYAALYPLAEGSDAAVFGLRFALLFALCLPPTFLMGGTLPLLLDGLVAEDRSLGAQASFLYGINILGAVLGVLLTAYFAIPLLGMNGTSRVGGAGNLLIGALALYAFRASAPLHGADEPLERPPRLYTALAVSTGAVAISWQVMHARFSSLLDVTTVHTTAVLLAVYLLALSLGSMLLARVLRAGWSPLRVFALAQLAVPILGPWAFHACDLIDTTSHLGALRAEDGRLVTLDTMQVRPAMAFFSEDVDRALLGPLLQIGLIVFVPVLFLGASLPALIAGATRRSGGLRSVSGTLVFWNTLGSSAGAFAAGYLLLPFLGLHRAVALIGAASLALAFIARRAAREPGEGRRFSLAFHGPAVLALLSIGIFAFVAADLTRHTIENYGLGKRLDDPTWHLGRERPRLVEIVEGTVETSYIYDSPEQIRLASGAVSFAGVAKSGIPGQAVQGHMPILLFPGEGVPARCLGVCVGSGQSFGAMLRYPIEQLDVVDISPSLVQLSLRHFAEYNHGLATDPRVRMHFDDGRHFVQRAPDGHYDLIAMEPPPPTADGVYSLYSLDFYRQVRRTLTERGVFMQWLPLYRVTPDEAQGIVKTQAAVFPETFLVKHSEQDFSILSYRSRPVFVQDAIRARCEVFAQERLIAGLRWAPGASAELASFEGVLATILTGPAAIAAMEAPEIYRDDTQRLAYGSGDRWLYHRYQGRHLSRISFAALPLSPMEELAPYFSPPLDGAQAAAGELERAISLQYFQVSDPRVLPFVERVAAEAPDPADRMRALVSLAKGSDAHLDKRRAFAQLGALIELDPIGADEEGRALARSLVRNHFAVYRDLIAAELEALRLRHPSSPLVIAARRAFDEAEAYEVERRARYLFPER